MRLFLLLLFFTMGKRKCKEKYFTFSYYYYYYYVNFTATDTAHTNGTGMTRIYTVEPLNNGQVGAKIFVRYSEVSFIGSFHHIMFNSPLICYIWFKVRLYHTPLPNTHVTHLLFVLYCTLYVWLTSPLPRAHTYTHLVLHCTLCLTHHTPLPHPSPEHTRHISTSDTWTKSRSRIGEIKQCHPELQEWTRNTFFKNDAKCS